MSRLFLFNKPFQVLSQFTDNEGRKTLADFIDQSGIYPAGRLDYDSEGLLLLTDDGRLQHRIASPDMKLPKTYVIQVEGEITDNALQQLRKGVELKDGLTRPAKARRIEDPGFAERVPPVRERKTVPTSWVELVISEGRNRQVRRMSAAIGFPTLRLVRIKIGDWTLSGIEQGQYKEIEVNLPVEAVKKAKRPHINRTNGKNSRAPNSYGGKKPNNSSIKNSTSRSTSDRNSESERKSSKNNGNRNKKNGPQRFKATNSNGNSANTRRSNGPKTKTRT